MIALELLVPLASNEGEIFTAEHHDAFQGVLTNLFGGCSRLPGTVTGTWLDEGRVYADQLLIFVVGVASITDGGKVAQAVEAAKQHYRQLAICIRYLGRIEVL
ncbi:MAG TPA: hypothetical protein VEB22_15565 [Phycisphaerales bacterium]|nr:hypothetical protein [Phycisphaerales bacterium]